MLLQYPDDLLFRVPALLHTPSSRLDYERTPASTGRVFREQVKTLIYTPSGSTKPGAWVQGPTFPDEGGVAIGANDAPAAMMSNGKILMAEGPYACGYCAPAYFFTYDYRTNELTAIDAPG